MSPQYQASDVARVARKFGVHERTVMKALAGLTVRGLAGERARLAVAELTATAKTDVAA